MNYQLLSVLVCPGALLHTIAILQPLLAEIAGLSELMGSSTSYCSLAQDVSVAAPAGSCVALTESQIKFM